MRCLTRQAVVIGLQHPRAPRPDRSAVSGGVGPRQLGHPLEVGAQHRVFARRVGHALQSLAAPCARGPRLRPACRPWRSTRRAARSPRRARLSRRVPSGSSSIVRAAGTCAAGRRAVPWCARRSPATGAAPRCGATGSAAPCAGAPRSRPFRAGICFSATSASSRLATMSASCDGARVACSACASSAGTPGSSDRISTARSRSCSASASASVRDGSRVRRCAARARPGTGSPRPGLDAKPLHALAHRVVQSARWPAHAARPWQSCRHRTVRRAPGRRRARPSAARCPARCRSSLRAATRRSTWLGRR